MESLRIEERRSCCWILVAEERLFSLNREPERGEFFCPHLSIRKSSYFTGKLTGGCRRRDEIYKVVGGGGEVECGGGRRTREEEWAEPILLVAEEGNR